MCSGVIQVRAGTSCILSEAISEARGKQLTSLQNTGQQKWSGAARVSQAAGLPIGGRAARAASLLQASAATLPEQQKTSAARSTGGNQGKQPSR